MLQITETTSQAPLVKETKRWVQKDIALNTIGENTLLTIEKVLILKSVDLFSMIPDETLVYMTKVLKEQRLERGEVLFEKGDLGTSMYLLIEGEVAIKDGEKLLATLAARNVFGEIAALDSETRNATIIANTSCYLFEIKQEILYELMTEHVEVAKSITKILCQRIRSLKSSKV